MIPPSFLQDLLSRIEILEVVGRYVQLKKSGSNFMGLCPFHAEKSPSFTVSPHKQFYHCFGCGAHGTAIRFLMEHTGLTFPEAVEELAHSIGLTVPKETSNQKYGPGTSSYSSKDKAAGPALISILQQASDYYRAQLRTHQGAIDYLKNRGIQGKTAARFGLGYAPPGMRNLQTVFANDQNEALIEAGLLVFGTAKEGFKKPAKLDPYDRFRNRITFPIRNTKGHIIGFGGRIFGEGEPKYLNSPETVLFDKGSELYGLFEAKQAIREKGYALVVEGYLDVLALAQQGFANTVATLGTACSSTHIRILLRYTDTIIFSFDGDQAGQRAARRALTNCLPFATDNRNLRFLFLPAEHDPDSYIRSHGTEAFATQVEQAWPLSEFFLHEVCANKRLDQAEGRAKALFEAKPWLLALPENALRLQIIQSLSERLHTPLEDVRALCELTNSGLHRRVIPAYSKQADTVTGNERRILRNLMAYPRLVEQLSPEQIQILTGSASTHAKAPLTNSGALFEEIIKHARSLGEQASFQMLGELLKDTQYAAIYEKLSREILAYDENVRDLLLTAPPIEAEKDEEKQRQEALAGEEVHDAILKMEQKARSERCDALSRQTMLTPDERAELSDLLRKTAQGKK